MGGQSHVIDICRRLSVLRHGDRTVPEPEIVHTVRTLGHSEERLAVSTLNAHDKHIFSVPLDCTGIERRMDSEAFHQVWIGLLVQIVAPEKRGMVCCDDRIHVAFIDAVSFYRFVFLCDEGLMAGLQPLQSFIECHDIFGI